MPLYNMNQLVGTADIAMLVFDTLRYDVAATEFAKGNTPHLSRFFPDGWEKRHSPGNFTYPAHHAFFSGFLPTPVDPNASRERLFATEFFGSETISERTKVFPTATIVDGFQKTDYDTICIGGVGFFNKQTALSSVFPDMFNESHWSEELGVTNQNSTENQIQLIQKRLETIPSQQRVFLYLNISAIHQPNYYYIEGKSKDDLETHAAALRYVDSCLPPLFDTLKKRSETFIIATSDHGTLYGEDGYTGHRVGHEAVYTVPYMESILSPN
jgi:hypothetical protein